MLEMQKTWAELEKETNEVNTNVRHLIWSTVAPSPVSFNPPVATMPVWFTPKAKEEEDDLERSIQEDN